MELLTKITYLRQQKGWSLYQLAQKSGLSFKTIYKWFNKETTPTIKALEAIAEAFQIPLYSLFTPYDTILADEDTKELLTKLNKLTPDQKEAVIKVIDSYLQ